MMSPERERRPADQYRAADVTRRDVTSIQQTTVTGVVEIDIRGVDEDTMYRRFFPLGTCPDGAMVRVFVDARVVDYRSLGIINRHSRRLRLEFVGVEPVAVGRWVRAAQTGDVFGEEVLLHG